MASTDKVRRFLEVLDMEKQYAILTGNVLKFHEERLRIDEEEDGQKIVQVQQFALEEVRKLLFPIVEDIYVNIFTDDELDELISVYSTPVFKRLLELSPEIQQRMFSVLGGKMNELEEKIENFVDGLFDEYDKASATAKSRLN